MVTDHLVKIEIKLAVDFFQSLILKLTHFDLLIKVALLFFVINAEGFFPSVRSLQEGIKAL